VGVAVELGGIASAVDSILGGEDAVEEWEPTHDDNFNMMLIVDAIKRESANYFVDEEGHIDSVWGKGDDAKVWAIKLRSRALTVTLSQLALVDMLLSVISAPGIPGGGEGLMLTGKVLQVVIWLIFSVVCCIRLRFMWSSRAKWFKGASEPYWICVQAFVLFVITPIELTDLFATGNHIVLQAGGESLQCPAYLGVFLQGWARAWTFIYFNKGVRDALTTLLQARFAPSLPVALPPPPLASPLGSRPNKLSHPFN